MQSNKLSSGTINRFNRLDVSHALNLLPGITLSAVGPRNESAVNVHGFDSKQVPQLSASQLRQNYFPLSSDFVTTNNEDGGHRNNSYRNDIGVSGKIGFTPTENQEYAIGYSYQHGKKGTPVYTGTDTQNSLFRNPRFWKWPNWDTQSLYFLSNNRIMKSFCQARLNRAGAFLVPAQFFTPVLRAIPTLANAAEA